MKKGSPEAKAWGKRMRSLRKREKSQKVNKPVSVKCHKVIRMSKKERKHGKKGTTFHVVPDLFYTGSAVELLGPAVGNMYDSARANGLSYAMDTVLPWAIQNQVMPAIVPAAELAVIGVVIQKAAKWLGVNRIGTKNVKVF